jgi:cytochrome c5
MNDTPRKYWLLTIAVSTLFSISIAAAIGQVAPAAKGPGSALAQNSASVSVAGEKVFAANCARCHTAPMTLNPRVTGTVVMHMRVRARLSSKDEQLLLKFLAPK